MKKIILISASLLTAVTGEVMSACTGTQITDIAIQENALITFRPLGAGKSTTVAGLTYTANTAVTRDVVGAAFANLANGATSGPGTATGSYSGSLSGWSSGTVTGANFNQVTFTSATSGNVTDITSSTTGATALNVAITQGTSYTLASLLSGNTVCVGVPGDWQAQEYHKIGGDLIDWKQGANDPVDPTTRVGKWSLTSGTGTLARVRYTYDTGTNYRVFDHSDGTFSFCQGTTEAAVATKIVTGQVGC